MSIPVCKREYHYCDHRFFIEPRVRDCAPYILNRENRPPHHHPKLPRQAQQMNNHMTEKRRRNILEELEFMTLMLGASDGARRVADAQGITVKNLMNSLKRWGEKDWVTRINEDRREEIEWSQQNAFNNRKKLTNC